MDTERWKRVDELLQAALRVPAKTVIAAEKRRRKERNAFRGKIPTLAAYQDFLTLWERCRPRHHMLKEAKSEYAKLK
jgi:uncharacterized protein YfbU (UPF0304 family)